MNIEYILAALQGGSLASVKDQLRTRLEPLPAAQQLQQLIQLIEDGQLHREQAVGVVAEAWDYIEVCKLWQADPIERYPSLECLKLKLDSQCDLQDMLQTHEGIAERKCSELAGIISQWGAAPHEVLPKRILPAWMSDHLLRRLRALSRVLTVVEAAPLLKTAIAERQLQHKSSYKDHHCTVIMSLSLRICRGVAGVASCFTASPNRSCAMTWLTMLCAQAHAPTGIGVW